MQISIPSMIRERPKATKYGNGGLRYGGLRYGGLRYWERRYRLDELYSSGGAQTGFSCKSEKLQRSHQFGAFCPITSQIKGYPFEVELPADGAVVGAVLADQINNMDWKARQERFERRADGRVIEEVIGKVSALLE